MYRTCFATLCFTLALASSARSQPALPPEIAAAIKSVESEARCYASPGPGEGETRPICVWRPASSAKAVLPVIYMADGMIGLEIAVLHLKAALDAGTIAPMMVVSLNAKEKPEDRASEYLRSWSAHYFELHEKWLLAQVIPWAERTMLASKERSHRFIGGFSNGADWALAMATAHPDIFGGALVHSPVSANPAWVSEQSATQRWVITGGTEELSGSIRRGGQLPRNIIRALRARGAPVRACIGPWEHHGRIWRQLSAGSLVWLMDLGTPESVETLLERNKCRNEE